MADAHALDRRKVLHWARSLEGPDDDPRIKASNDAVNGYLAGLVTRRSFRRVAYVADGLRYQTPAEVMAYFAAMVALETRLSKELLGEATDKAQEMMFRADGEVPQDPAVIDGHRWTPADGDAELAEWESILGRR